MPALAALRPGKSIAGDGEGMRIFRGRRRGRGGRGEGVAEEAAGGGPGDERGVLISPIRPFPAHPPAPAAGSGRPSPRRGGERLGMGRRAGGERGDLKLTTLHRRNFLRLRSVTPIGKQRAPSVGRCPPAPVLRARPEPRAPVLPASQGTHPQGPTASAEMETNKEINRPRSVPPLQGLRRVGGSPVPLPHGTPQPGIPRCHRSYARDPRGRAAGEPQNPAAPVQPLRPLRYRYWDRHRGERFSAQPGVPGSNPRLGGFRSAALRNGAKDTPGLQPTPTFPGIRRSRSPGCRGLWRARSELGCPGGVSVLPGSPGGRGQEVPGSGSWSSRPLHLPLGRGGPRVSVS